MSDYTSEHSRPASPVGPLPDIANAQGKAAYRFNWDSRRPGPGSVSETTEGRGDYFSVTPKVDIYGASASSANLALDAVPSQWSSAKNGFHAISTVVNNPHKKSAPPKAHSVVPSVPPADLPRVRRKDFDAYLRAIEPEWDRFQKSAELGRAGAAQIAQAATPALDFEFVPETPRTPRPTKALPPLSSIPQVFFDPKFNLGDPKTFNAVAETSSSSSVYNPASPMTATEADPSALAHSLPLLEKLSHHADTLEQHLVSEIAKRATPFFAALSNLQDLQAESARCLARIQSLRGQLQAVDTQVAMRGLNAVRREARLARLERVREGVRVVVGVVELVGVARNLVGAGQWGEALSVVEELHAMWDGSQTQPPELPDHPPRTPLPSVAEEPPDGASADFTNASSTAVSRRPQPSIPLSSLKAFANLPGQLQTLTLEIAASLTTDLVGVLKVDLVERIYGAPEGRSDADINSMFRDRLRPLVQGLIRTKTVREAMAEWRLVVLSEVKGVVQRHIPSFEPENGDLKPGFEQPWVTHVRGMGHQEFMSLLREIYRSFLNCIEGLRASSSILTDVLNSMQSANSSADMASVQDTLFDVLASSAEQANILSSKVMSARAEQHAKLELQEFVELFNESWSFVVRCEVICRRMIVGLRGVVIGQAKSFLQTFHQSRISQSAKLVEDEQWSQAEVSPSLQHIANLLVDAAVHDPHEFILKVPPPVAAPPPSPLPTQSTLMPPGSPSSRPGSPRSPSLRPVSPRPTSPRPISPRPQSNGQSGSPTKHLRIEDRSYFIVSATSEALILVTDYLKVIVNLSLLTTDTMSRIIEFLKAFNSRTCQVVLGAGAMRSAGLKNITAKHLALASQSLSIMIALIPYIRETFRRHLNPKQAVMLVEFDKLKRDYQEHQNEIHSKLIAIMGDRLAAHIKTLQSVRWDAPPPKPGINGYMELLVKETVTLHKVLSRYLSSAVVEYVMSQVFAAINHRLSEEFTNIELPSAEAKERLLADAQYLHAKFSVLKNVTAPMGMLETVVSEKRVGPPGQPTSPLPSPRPTPTKRTSLFANERIKGMLGRAAGTAEKSLPTPAPSPGPPTSPSPNPNSPRPNGTSSTATLVNGSGPTFIPNGSSVSLLSSGAVTPNVVPPLQPAPPPPEKKGFKQVEIRDEPAPVDEPPPPPTPAKDPVAEPAKDPVAEPAKDPVAEPAKETPKEPELVEEPEAMVEPPPVETEKSTPESAPAEAVAEPAAPAALTPVAEDSEESKASEPSTETAVDTADADLTPRATGDSSGADGNVAVVEGGDS
ncbi:Vps54-domain-containing protein [Dentipellis sp. KUC8613]|nr:Vps54-domain-containing protein [Dentipellis sp. KUC8613]